MLLTQSNKLTLVNVIKNASIAFAADPLKLFHVDGDYNVIKNNFNEVEVVFQLYYSSNRVVSISPDLFESCELSSLEDFVEGVFKGGAVKQASASTYAIRDILSALNGTTDESDYVTPLMSGLKVTVTKVPGTSIRYAVLSDSDHDPIAKFSFATYTEWAAGITGVLPSINRRLFDLAMVGKIDVTNF